MAALQYIRRRLAKRIKLLQDRCIPLVLQDGIQRLPDEILIHVFEAGHALTDTHKFSLNMSDISRRFRSLAIRTPLLWTRLSFGPSNHLIRLFISRSVHMDLSISIKKTGNSPKLKLFLEVISSLSERWTHLRVHDLPPNSRLPPIIPRLQRLQYDRKRPNHLLALPMPSMVHFHGISVRPTASHRLQLTNCELHLKGILDVDRLCRAVYEMKNLRHLSITLDGCSSEEDEFFDPWSDDEEEDTEFHYVNLDSFSFSIKNRTSVNVVGMINESMRRWLSLHTTKLAVEYATVKHAETLLQPVGIGLMFPSPVMSVRLPGCVDPDESSDTFDLLTLVVSAIARDAPLDRSDSPAFTVSIESPVTSFISPYELSQPLSEEPWTWYAGLRNLRLKNCERLYEWHVQAFAEKLTSFPEGNGLKSLEIISCRNISEDYLMDLREEMGDKLRLSWVL
ncbi:hypothetical protein BD410DRAFT_120140 [Rickenella mellea]|uniref:F-box domain-containing protein n=1 Tax=Rickenella mellea TaxID=50990 RepID=A0A4Y7QAV7_9AGAM|nr:hypothetical protein BD410DRAFT_120140 [Rickenella mellea]